MPVSSVEFDVVTGSSFNSFSAAGVKRMHSSSLSAKRAWSGTRRTVHHALVWLALFTLDHAFPSEPTAESPRATVPGELPYRNLRQLPFHYNDPGDDLVSSTEVRIGWFGPVDSTNRMAQDMWWAANRAVKDANVAAALKSPENAPATHFQLVARWSDNPWGTGVAQLARMVYEERPAALMGSIDSASTHLAEQIVAKANLPLISPIATDPSVTLAGVPWMFSCAPSDDAIAHALVGSVLATMEQRHGRLALISTTDHESRMTTRAVIHELSRRQHPPDFHFELTPHRSDFGGVLSSLHQTEPAVVIIIANLPDSAHLVRAVQRREPGNAPDGPASLPPTVFGGPAMARSEFQELAGRFCEGVCFPLLGFVDLAQPEAQRFVEGFVTERQHLPDYAALLTYDATRLLLRALSETGPNRSQLRATLSQLTPWTGIAGTIDFDRTGQNRRAGVGLATWRSGRTEYTHNAFGTSHSP